VICSLHNNYRGVCDCGKHVCQECSAHSIKCPECRPTPKCPSCDRFCSTIYTCECGIQICNRCSPFRPCPCVTCGSCRCRHEGTCVRCHGKTHGHTCGCGQFLCLTCPCDICVPCGNCNNLRPPALFEHCPACGEVVCDTCADLCDECHQLVACLMCRLRRCPDHPRAGLTNRAGNVFG
jgi:hypothetical protein